MDIKSLLFLRQKRYIGYSPDWTGAFGDKPDTQEIIFFVYDYK
jgi:hypothetical protein